MANCINQQNTWEAMHPQNHTHRYIYINIIIYIYTRCVYNSKYDYKTLLDEAGKCCIKTLQTTTLGTPLPGHMGPLAMDPKHPQPTSCLAGGHSGFFGGCTPAPSAWAHGIFTWDSFYHTFPHIVNQQILQGTTKWQHRYSCNHSSSGQRRRLSWSGHVNMIGTMTVYFRIANI